MLTASPQIHSPADEPVDQSVLENQAQSVGHLFRDRVAATPDRPAFMHAVVGDSGDDWVTVSWSELDTDVREIGAGLVALGIEPQDRVAVASNTRYEWALADLAIMVSGGATTTIYPTTIADDVAFIVADSGAKVVFAENTEQLEKLRSVRASTPAVTRVVVFDGVADADAWTLTLDE
ncbi:MAG TPA: AMP-binding protein, partial [Ornithinibacter sp.]|nr:AMP-binding protein [Ornithinibacter sp.]